MATTPSYSDASHEFQTRLIIANCSNPKCKSALGIFYMKKDDMKCCCHITTNQIGKGVADAVCPIRFDIIRFIAHSSVVTKRGFGAVITE